MTSHNQDEHSSYIWYLGERWRIAQRELANCREIVRLMSARGTSARQMAKALGVSHQTVINWINQPTKEGD